MRNFPKGVTTTKLGQGTSKRADFFGQRKVSPVEYYRICAFDMIGKKTEYWRSHNNEDAKNLVKELQKNENLTLISIEKVTTIRIEDFLNDMP